MADKGPVKSAKPAEKKQVKKDDSLSKGISKIMKNAAIALAVFVLLVFILGQAFAYYAMKSGGAALMWAPIIILVAILFYKIID